MRAHLVKLGITMTLYCIAFTEVWLSSVGVEPGQLQAEDQPHWSRWLPEHSDRLPWWLPVCIWWKGIISIHFLYLLISTVLNDSGSTFGLAGFVNDESEASVLDWWKTRGCFWETPAFVLTAFFSSVTCRGAYMAVKPCNHWFGSYWFLKVVSSVVTDTLVSSIY